MEEAKKVIVTPTQESQDAEEILQQAVSDSEVRLQVRPEVISDEDQEKEQRKYIPSFQKLMYQSMSERKMDLTFCHGHHALVSCFSTFQV